MNGKTPSIAVIMAVKSPAPWLNFALESLLNQHETDWELCVVLDGHNDQILKLISSMIPEAKVSQLPPGSGASACRNKALAIASASLAAVLDSDDVWNADHLANHILAFSSDESLVLRGTSALTIDESGEQLREELRPPTRWLPVQLLFRNCFVHSSTAYRVQPALAVGGYPTELSIGEDYDLWLRLASVGKVTNSGKASVLYRRHINQVSKKRIKNHELNLIAESRRRLGAKLHLPRSVTDLISSAWNRKQMHEVAS